MSTADELNEEFGSYGYQLETFAWHDSNYQVRRLDGYGGHLATFKDVEDVEAFLRQLAASDNPWCIGLEHGNVDVDRETGLVTPRDGGPAFDLHDLHPDDWSVASDDAPKGFSSILLTASQVCIKSRSRPPYGGLWFKRI
jgi:hypothetical protein